MMVLLRNRDLLVTIGNLKGKTLEVLTSSECNGASKERRVTTKFFLKMMASCQLQPQKVNLLFQQKLKPRKYGKLQSILCMIGTLISKLINTRMNRKIRATSLPLCHTVSSCPNTNPEQPIFSALNSRSKQYQTVSKTADGSFTQKTSLESSLTFVSLCNSFFVF